MAKWTDDAAATALRLWDEGYSASKISREVGMSRCAVIGKLMRMGADKRGTTKSIFVVTRPKDPDRLAKQRERDRIKKRRKYARIKEQARKDNLLRFSPSLSRTSPVFRNNLPRAPEMTKTELRAMISEAMRNTAEMKPVLEAAE